MSKNPSMKLHEWQSKNRSSGSGTTAKDGTDGWVKPQPCCVCNKVVKGAYGHTNLAEVVWSCSAVCEKEVQQMRRRFYAARHQGTVASAPAG